MSGVGKMATGLLGILVVAALFVAAVCVADCDGPSSRESTGFEFGR